MTHIRDIIQIVMALKKSLKTLYHLDNALTDLQGYENNPELREMLWDSIKTIQEIFDKIDIKDLKKGE